MRTLVLASALLLSSAMIAPAFALEAGDTMQAWKHSTGPERSALLEKILGKEIAGNAKVARCMDETATTPGHTDLRIDEVAKVCAMPGNLGQPV